MLDAYVGLPQWRGTGINVITLPSSGKINKLISSYSFIPSLSKHSKRQK